MISNKTTQRPFFTLPSFFPSPEKSYILPSYAEAIASTLASEEDFSTQKKSSSLDPAVLRFLDVEAVESDMDISSTDSSAHSQSMSTSSS